jgi:putative ABC transport system permease protein
LPYGNAGVGTTNVWIPLALTPQQAADRDNDSLNTIARLKPGVSREVALSEMSAIMRRLDALHSTELRGWGAAIKSLPEATIGNARPLLWLLLGAVCCVLLVACGNAANLLLARAAARSHEFGVRATLGAGRLRVMRQLLTESLLLSGIAGVAGIVLAWFFLRLLLHLDPGDIPRLQEASLNLWVLLFAAALVVVTCLLFGTLPAISTSRIHLIDTLKSGGTRGTVSGQNPGRSLLIAGQVGLVVLLLAGAGLLIRSYTKLMSVKTGFAASTITFNVALDARYHTTQQRLSFFRNLLERLAGIPGVRASGAVNFLPLSNSGSMTFLWVDGYRDNNKDQLVEDDRVTQRYFSAMDTPLFAGRFFTDADRAGSPLVVIVNQSFAKQYFPGKSALGHRLRTGGHPNSRWETIVGVVGDLRGTRLEDTPAPQLYSPFWQGDAAGAFVATRSSLPPEMLVASIRAALRAIDPTIAAANIQTMGQAITAATSRRRFQTTLLTIFGAIALLLALVGLYGVLAYSVRQRVAEIGVRIALGASRARVIGMVVRQGLRLVLIGLALGFAAAFLLVRFLAGVLYDVSPYDPWTFAAAPALILLAALIACSAPAWRAAHIDPIEALRSE